MKTLLRAEVLTGDDDFVARFGFVRFDFANLGTLAPVADRVPFDFFGVGSLDRFGIEEGEACPIDDRAFVWLFCAGYRD